jgi:YidC/Oxa1 family membrane protein insertase
MEGRLSGQMSQLKMEWGMTVPQQEKGFANENNYSYLAYKSPGDDKVHTIGLRKTGGGKDTASGNVQWVAMKQQFFTTTLVSRGNFQSPEMSYETFAPESGMLKKYNASANVVYNRMQNAYGFRYYFGPVEYRQLKSYDLGMERLVSLGWSIVRWVNTGLVIPVFNFLSGKHLGMGLIILLLTLMIKIIIMPLTWKSYMSMARMRVLKPEIDEINAKFPKQEDAMKKQQATMELYRRAGVSPMGGCLPMLIQFPFIIALFSFFPSAIELRGQSFLWADDLSTYDSILNLPFNIPWYGNHVSLFCLLMAVSLFINTRLTSKTQPSSGPGAGMMKSMMYLMPIMLLLWFNNYSSGLCYYYLLSNLITIGTTWGMRAMVDDNKLHAQMKANAAKKAAASKGKPKSKWQQRYEEALRQQQQMRQQQQKKR